MKRAYAQKNALGPLAPRTWESIKTEAQNNPNVWQIFDNGKLRTIFYPDYRLLALDLNDPRIAEGFRISLEALRQMQAKTQGAHQEFEVLLLPTKETVFNSVVLENPGTVPETYKTLTSYEEQARQKTKAFLLAQGIHFIDALPALQESLHAGNQPYPISLDGHPNAIGHRAVASWVLHDIEKNNLLRKGKIPG